MVRVIRIAARTPQLQEPDAPEWGSLTVETLALSPTPILSQPSAYVQTVWNERPYGVTKEVSVQAAHNGEFIFFRLSWPDATKNDTLSDTDAFTDAAAVLFPDKGDAPLTGMGSPDQPVFAWLWRPDLEEPYHVVAQGIGTTKRLPANGIVAKAEHDGAGWSLVISRRLSGKGAGLLLAPGAKGKVAFAIWQGSERERGGLKSATLEWQPLEIEA
jgi:DMSO reductase family type II enzyme heme b subunit